MTAKIKLNSASGGGSISIQAPSSSSNNRVISLPDIADGTLVTSQSTLDATKLSGALPAISGANLTGLAAGKFASYAIICQTSSSGSHGGSFSSGDWRTRELNTELADADGIVSISSNQFTLQAGSYMIHAIAPAQSVVTHKAKIRNVTDSSDAIIGSSAYSSQDTGGLDSVTNSFVKGRITISGAKTFELQHRCQVTRNGAGFGQPSGFGVDEIYSIVEIYKEN